MIAAALCILILPHCLGFGVDKSLKKFIDVHDSHPFVELSSDRGKTWTATAIPADDVNEVASDLTGNILVVAGNDNPMQISWDRGLTWMNGSFATTGKVTCRGVAISYHIALHGLN